MSNMSTDSPSYPISRRILFNIYIIFIIPSLTCSIIIFYYFARMTQLRKQPSNHVILVLSIVLFIEAFTDLPSRLHFLNKNTVLIHTSGGCLFWNWSTSVLNIIGLHLMAFASIERYFFIFHGQFLSRHRFLLCRIPMLFSIIYPFVFYTTVVFGSYWCQNNYDYSVLACGAPCYLLTSTFFPIFGVLTHHVLPVFIVFFANIILIIRVFHQKSRMRQSNIWRKNLAMTIQLISIAFLYLIFWIPQCIFFLMLSLGTEQLKSLASFLIYEYTGNCTSFTIIFCPFITLFGLPPMYKKIKEDFIKVFRTRSQIGPASAVQTATGRRMEALHPRT